MKKFLRGRFVCLALSFICIAYWLWILLLYGPISWLHVFLLLGLFLLGMALCWDHPATNKKVRLPKCLRRIVILLLVLCLSWFSWEEIRIISVGRQEDSGSGDTIVILGAGLVHENEISLTLQYRLEKGLIEHQKNPDALMIVSGGKGSDEAISEASAMKQWLVEHDVDASQILIEDQSRSTYENFRNTRSLMERNHMTSFRITLITNRFHMRRARYLGEAQGFEITQKPASDLLFAEPCMYSREFFALLKAYFLTDE